MELEDLTDKERGALKAHIEEGYLQAERGELIDCEIVKRQIHAMKEAWRTLQQNPFRR